MSLTQKEARQILNQKGLRVTAPRLAVLSVLASAKSPMSHTKVLDQLKKSSWDPATIYRNLVKLCDAQVAVVVSRANGIARMPWLPNMAKTITILILSVKSVAR